MYKYTIKKDIEKGIYLLNEQGEEVAATDILEKCGDRRVFAFNGNMGAGKTTFIKQLCEAMGTEDIVNSFKSCGRPFTSAMLFTEKLDCNAVYL